ncbi:putative B3 domain-containing protein At5g58280 [Diospyros lotus]|uniref:putative B3 domain-containing protein At5g58280 n=1 Tax=Diospyros lotus TaxID=55363 RepID=UPI002253237A|nr:putative B3 domain-containing protein At5g58280 [Diospyros lotus]XP_052184675.1 putative B3 domain-containing protein At5g58280 [Diospyros lotus]XP_052184676.1 putative B3 domain-containing protein At5g58280 [Diospyros lotus]XP_052184677.1 putative B3 domain-containing protein At5g58280 [Diospyros lotus]
MAPKSVSTYEEARKQRIEENKKCFENLGISKTLKCLAELQSSEKSVKRHPKPKSESIYTLEPRRSSRARNPVPSYRDDVNIELPHLRKRSRISSSWASYIARPLDECKTASYEERSQAFNGAEDLQGKLTAGNPSFVKSMVRSHVYSCFWLGLPSKFCEDHLPKTTVDMVLESENGAEYDAVYIGKRTGLSGGWRAFALEHKLDDGDALVFELIDPARFKIYIVRAASCSSEEDDDTAVRAGDNKSASSHGAEKADKKSEQRPKTRTKKDVGSSKASSSKKKKK